MRPKIICHMMSSVDGRLITQRYSDPYNGKTNEEVTGYYFPISDQLNGDAVLIGRTTVQEYFMPKTFKHEGLEPTSNFEIFKGRLDGSSTIIITDPKGKVFYEDYKDENFIAILSEQVSDEYLNHLRENKISYLFAGKNGENLSIAMEILGLEFGLKTILLEGGGFINGSFLKAGLIDELSLMIYPGIDGLAGIPSIFEWKGLLDEKPAEGQSLEFKFLKQLEEGIIWLYYQFHKK